MSCFRLHQILELLGDHWYCFSVSFDRICPCSVDPGVFNMCRKLKSDMLVAPSTGVRVLVDTHSKVSSANDGLKLRRAVMESDDEMH